MQLNDKHIKTIAISALLIAALGVTVLFKMGGFVSSRGSKPTEQQTEKAAAAQDDSEGTPGDQARGVTTSIFAHAAV